MGLPSDEEEAVLFPARPGAVRAEREVLGSAEPVGEGDDNLAARMVAVGRRRTFFGAGQAGLSLHKLFWLEPYRP